MSTSMDKAQSAALAAARMAGFAPSIHNTQPWHWRVSASTLQLVADRTRQLGVTDPSGRLLTVSCGAALHHARVALAAEAWQVEVRLTPDPADGDLLATIDLVGRTEVDPASMRDLQMLRVRRTDRRPVVDAPVPRAVLDELVSVVEATGARLHLLRADDVIELASTADRAQRAESMDSEWREEMAYWAGVGHDGGHGAGLGVPDTAIPEVAPETTVPARDFGHPGSLPVGTGHDSSAAYAILYGDDDTPAGWLRGGQALSAAWIRALERGLTVLPLSAAVEVPVTRQTLRRMLAGLGEPYLVLRIGVGHEDSAGPDHTPRLPAEQVVEIVE